MFTLRANVHKGQQGCWIARLGPLPDNKHSCPMGYLPVATAHDCKTTLVTTELICDNKLRSIN